MDQNTFREHLTQLHAELDRVREEHPAAREALGETLAHLKRVADAAPGAETPARDPALPDRLERFAVEFEVKHPTLAASARRLVDLLGEAGI
jgi:hypothetical protein